MTHLAVPIINNILMLQPLRYFYPNHSLYLLHIQYMYTPYMLNYIYMHIILYTAAHTCTPVTETHAWHDTVYTCTNSC